MFFWPQEGKRRRKQRKERLATIFRTIDACFPASQLAVSLSTMKPLSQPTNKPTGPFDSVGPLAWDQVMPLNKELLSCITSPQRGQPGRSLLSPGTASLKHTKASARPASLQLSVTALSQYTTMILTLYPREGFISAFKSVNG